MITARARRLAVAPALGWLVVAAAAVPASATPEGPPYFDPKRGIERQQEAAKAAVQDVKGAAADKVYEHLGSVSAYVRDAVYAELLKTFTEDQLIEVSKKGLFHPDPFVAGQLAEALGTRKLKAAAPYLEEALKKQKSEEVLGEVCWALGEIGEAGAAKELDKVAKRFERSSYLVAGEAWLALARCDKGNAAAHLKDGIASKSAGVRIVCLADLTALDAKQGLEAALAQLDDKQEKGWEPRVLFQVLECFRAPEKRKPHKELYKTVVDRLIPKLESEDGRAKHEVGKTLRSITGQWDLGDDHEAWKYWWQTTRDRFEPADKDAKRKGEDAGATGTVSRYFGIPIYSKRLVFLLDLSGGMDRPVGGPGSDTPRRLNVAKDELKATLATLEKDVAANVIFFASKYFPCAEQLLPVAKMLKKLCAYIDEQEIPTKMHENRGNLYDPLIVAALQNEVDTIFLVTEGNPTEGRFIDRDRFVRHMLRTLKYTKTEVHSLFIGNANSARAYLTAISEPTGGAFYDVAEMKGWK